MICKYSLSDIIIKLFADDTNCFISGYNFSEVAKTVKNELNSLMKWITANKVTINFDPKNQATVFLVQIIKNYLQITKMVWKWEAINYLTRNLQHI